MLTIKTSAISNEMYNELKARKERESVKKSLIDFLNSELMTMKKNEVKQIDFEKDVHYYSVLKALREFDSKIEYKLNAVKSRVHSIAIKVK